VIQGELFTEELSRGRGGNVKPFSKEEIYTIESMIKEGKTHMQIAISLNRSKDTISQEISKNGGNLDYNAERRLRQAEQRRLARVEQGYRKLCEEEIEKIKQMRAEKNTHYQIANELNCSLRTVTRCLKNEYRNDSITFMKSKIEEINMQIDILFETIKEIKNDIQNRRL